MTVTRTPLCSVKDCYIPEEMHYCWGQKIEGHKCFGGLTHQHKPKKGMGGNNAKSKVAAILCAGLHDQLDNNAGRPYKDDLRHGDGGDVYYRIYNPARDHLPDQWALVWVDISNWLHGETQLDIVIGVGDGDDISGAGATVSDGGDFSVDGTDGAREFDAHVDADRPGGNFEYGGSGVSNLVGASTGGVSGSSLSAEASNLIAPDTVPSRETTVGGDYETAVETSPNRVTTVTGPGGGLSASPRPFLDMDFEEWRSWGPRLAHNLNASRWLLGEWLLDGEAKWGQMYAQAEAETGLDYSTLTSYRSVVKAYREAELLPQATTSFSVLSVLAPVVRRDAEEGERLLNLAEAQSMTGDEVRREVKALTGEVEHETRLCDMGYSHRV